MICQGAAAARPAIGAGAVGAAIDRLDLDAVIGLADQLLERRALQHAIDQLAPVVVGRRRKIRRQPQFVGWSSFAQSFPDIPLYWAGNCHGATAKPNLVLGPFGQPRSGSR